MKVMAMTCFVTIALFMHQKNMVKSQYVKVIQLYVYKKKHKIKKIFDFFY